MLNKTQVLCSVMKPFLPLSRAENNWNLGQWATQEREEVPNISTQTHLNALTIVKQRQLVCVKSLLAMPLMGSIMTSTMTFSAIKCTSSTKCSIMEHPPYQRGELMVMRLMAVPIALFFLIKQIHAWWITSNFSSSYFSASCAKRRASVY